MSTAVANPSPSLKQPRQLWMLFFAEMWERFSFYGMRALLVLYLTSALFKDLQNPAKEELAYGIYGAYGALVYAMPFFGGILADKILGYRKSVLLGGVLMMIGHFIMAIETEPALYLALAFLIIGNGFFKPNISSMVGGLYGENDPRRDGGFTIFYMGINLGAFFSPLLCGYLGETYGWSYGFGLAGVGMLLGLIVFGRGQGSLGENGLPPDPTALTAKTSLGISREWLTYAGAIVAVLLVSQLIHAHELLKVGLPALGIALLGYLLFLAFFRYQKVERERLLVIIALTVFSVLFWAFFEQGGSSLSLFTDRNIDRNLLGWQVPTSMFQAVNPFVIVALGPVFASLWVRLGKYEPPTPVKFSLALMQVGLGFLVFVWGAAFAHVSPVEITSESGAVTTVAAATVPVIFLLIGYVLHTTGELCLSPVGLSMVTKLAPHQIQSMMMGVWFFSASMAHHVGGIIAQFTTVAEASGAAGELAVEAGILANKAGLAEEVLKSYDQLASYVSVFGMIGWTSIGAGVFLLILSPVLKRWMHGIS